MSDTVSSRTPAVPRGETGPKVSELGEAAVLFEAPGELEERVQSRIWSMAAEVERWPSVTEVVMGMTNLLVMYDPFADEPGPLGKRLIDAWGGAKPLVRDERVIRVPVTYGGESGPDLKDVAAYAGLSTADVVRLHTQARYVVFALGSSPGFGYLGGLPKALFMPRRPVPILRAEARSVMIGGMQTGVSSAAGPTGWHVIGRSEIIVFDAAAQSPALLQPGDVVKFEALDIVK
jgi:KipI family sensor histidine kinase inhibitor